jgi:hypothetical protein
VLIGAGKSGFGDRMNRQEAKVMMDRPVTRIPLAADDADDKCDALRFDTNAAASRHRTMR